MPKCRGQYSIQAEVNKRIKQGFENWGEMIRKPETREYIRQELLKLRDEWCDYKTGTCFCKSAYIPKRPKNLEIFFN